MTLGVTNLVHACITCSDLERSIAFYADVLEAEIGVLMEVDLTPAAQFLQFEGDGRCRAVYMRWNGGETLIELQQYFPSGSAIRTSTKDLGLARFALRVRDFDAARDWINAKGVPIVGEIEIEVAPGRRRRALSVHDPDGTLVELIEYAEETYWRSQ